MGITPVINNKKNTVEPMFTFSSSSAAAASASSCASNSVPGTASATSCSSSSSSSSGRCYQRGKPTSSTMTGRPEVAQQHSQRSSRDVCNCCKVKFSSSVLNLILKKTCPSCQKLVCPSCLVFTLKIPKSLCMCKKCAKLMTFNFEPRHLMRLHGKELREILSAMDIPYVDGSEKSELVQLILRHRGGDIWTPSHPEPPLGRTTNNAATNQQQVPSPLRSEENIPSAPPIEEEEAAAAEEVQDEKGSTRPSEEGGRREEEEDDDDEEFVFVPPFAPREPPPPPPPREPPSPPPPPPPRFKPPSSSTPSSPRNRPEINLNEILSETEIEGLTIRELKSILLKNSVDYKGCCEKYELAARVTQLWHSAKKSNVDVETLSEDEICKICMNAPIDCVMLECGHMATCTRCGRQMNECPICRQYVVRVVRTFRA